MSSENVPSGSTPISPQPLAAGQPPVRVILEQPRRGMGRLGTRLLWVVLAFSLLANLSQRAEYRSYFVTGSEIQEKFVGRNPAGSAKVAVITIEGLITGRDAFVKKQIDAVREDAAVKAVVLRVDSPGGTVTGSDYIYHHLKKLAADPDRKLPIVVSMGGLAASGGYYVAMAAGPGKNVFAEPTTWTGSIGVIIPHYDFSGLLDKLAVSDDSIASHKFKQLGSPTRKLPENERAEERAVLQDLVNESFANFKQIVLEARPALMDKPEWQTKAFTGQVFSAKQAQQLGLVDEIGYLEDAVTRAIELARVSGDDVRVMKYARQPGLLDQALGIEGVSGKADTAALLDLTATRAYYLSTWLPAVVIGRNAP